jgi:hypothetical protein
MPEEVVTAAIEAWQHMCQEVHARCLEVLGPFLRAAEALSFVHATDLPDAVIPEPPAMEHLMCELLARLQEVPRDL